MRTLRYYGPVSYISLFVLVFLVPVTLHAHGFGVSYEENKDGYLVDIGYDPEIFTTDSRALFDFTLYYEGTEEDVEYSDVWLRINQGTRVIFAGGIHSPEFGTAGILYTFPEEGEYAISVRFQNMGEALTEVTFPVTVILGEKTSPFNATSVIVGLVGVLSGVFVTFIATRRRRT
ncbi:MAG: hypothetical protein WD509_00945 [Candidatus Paceibacterota bacterium]